MFFSTGLSTGLSSFVAPMSSGLGFDVIQPITDGMNTLVTQVTGIIGVVAPGAIGITGAVMAITLGIRVFRSLVR
ncbi:MAG: hypothetical protein FWE05_13710 [Defluviitaleaceae bacterium]|nr:hypothetical protein [Defluviitaleaceae bacterium]